MPFLTVKTNCEVKAKMAEDLAEVSAKVLEKPLKAIAVSIEENKNMAFDGKNDNKGAWIELGAIGYKDKEKTVTVLTDWVENNLGAKRELISINLSDLTKEYVAHNGKLLG